MGMVAGGQRVQLVHAGAQRPLSTMPYSKCRQWYPHHMHNTKTHLMRFSRQSRQQEQPFTVMLMSGTRRSTPGMRCWRSGGQRSWTALCRCALNPKLSATKPSRTHVSMLTSTTDQYPHLNPDLSSCLKPSILLALEMRMSNMPRCSPPSHRGSKWSAPRLWSELSLLCCIPL